MRTPQRGWVIDEYYAVMERRPPSVTTSALTPKYYLSLLQTLGPSTRVSSRCVMPTKHPDAGTSAALVRGSRAGGRIRRLHRGRPSPASAPVLDFLAARFLARDGVREFDLMTPARRAAPTSTVSGKYKSTSPHKFTDVPGGWDMPIKKATYRALKRRKGSEGRSAPAPEADPPRG